MSRTIARNSTVDFGPYNFFQNDQVPTPASSIPARDEQAIRLALGLSGEIDLWSKYHL